MLLTIPIPEKVSLNRIYAGVHFTTRAEHKEDWYYSVLEAKPQRYQGEYPVEMHYHFKTSGSPLDISNHAYMLKMCEDALVHCKVLPDDTQQYVGWLSTSAEKVKNGEPQLVEVSIRKKCMYHYNIKGSIKVIKQEGYGFIMPDEPVGAHVKDIFFHASALADEDLDWGDLDVGQRVEIGTVFVNPKGIQAIDVRRIRPNKGGKPLE